ncbi:vanadium-dependent haloperoxidase [Salisaeta longa]|uniref:vanadium-dependent haloperoxidase n=1 Tax=Salisaeta longa TaxID=503170 RepID=UPI001B7F8DC2|nr:vanadium-dependent haloperoxidase [Salisaeta longa]
MVYDIFSPPQASRAFAYTSVAAYEALQHGDPAYQSLAGQLNGLTPVPAPDTTRPLALEVAAVHAFFTVGRSLVYSTKRLDAVHQKMRAYFKKQGVPAAVLRRSVVYGDTVAAHIQRWMAADRYKQTRSASQFTVTDEPGRWQPTPPAYMDAIEPNWDKLRPFVMQRAAQFKPARPYDYSMQPGTPFYKQVMAVYEAVKNASKEERAIAAFWDCNPYVMHTRGHVMYATKHITPGAHWMGIAAVAARKDSASLMRTAETYALTGVTLADGFISAWDEKYRSDLVRPETVINEHIDPDWRPILQTPPFPEYTSAHSVISAAAAEMLTALYGPNFAFRDTVEVEYGLPARSYASFRSAAQEAGVSRLYGGIHYPMAYKRGLTQGRQLGRYAVQTLRTRAAGAPALAARRNRAPARGVE